MCCLRHICYSPIHYVWLIATTCSDMCISQFMSACYRRTQYDALRMCVGEEMCKKLAELRLFMVIVLSVAMNYEEWYDIEMWWNIGASWHSVQLSF